MIGRKGANGIGMVVERLDLRTRVLALWTIVIVHGRVLFLVSFSFSSRLFHLATRSRPCDCVRHISGASTGNFFLYYYSIFLCSCVVYVFNVPHGRRFPSTIFKCFFSLSIFLFYFLLPFFIANTSPVGESRDVGAARLGRIAN